MRDFKTVSLSNTVSEFVDAFNNNALASSNHTWYLGEMLYNGLLYTGLETIGGQQLHSLTNLNISSISPVNLEFDNLYLYFRDINKILLVDQKTFDLSSFNTNQPTFLFINSRLGFRASQNPKQQDDEIQLLRFIISETGIFKQCYVTAQRFGSNVYDTADEFFQVTGCTPLPYNNTQLKMGDGSIKRSGIKFDYHQVPDILTILDNNEAVPIRYITDENTVNFDDPISYDVITTKYLNYTTNTLSNVPSDKFTSQRILYDPYTNCLIIQYGDGYYGSMSEALSSLENLVYPFPYNTLMFIPLAVIFIKKGCTDLSNTDECQIVQHLSTTVERGNSTFFAEDAYARGRIAIIQQQFNDLQTSLSTQIQTVTNNLNSHVNNLSNPHQVTKAQVGLGNVDNISFSSMKTELDSRYIKKSGNEVKNNNLTITGEFSTSPTYIVVGGRRVYVASASGQRVGDYLLP